MRAKHLFIRRFSLLLFSNLLFGLMYCQSFNLVGTASSLGGNCYSLTGGNVNEKGAIWSTSRIDISQPFDMTFHVNFPIWGADGMAFVLQNDPAGVNAIARDPGNTLGAYRRLPGCTGPIPPCAATSRRGVEPGIGFELDIWNNSGAGADDITAPACCKDDHVSVINTMSPDVAILGPQPALFDTIDITDNTCRRFRVTWNPTTQLIQMFYGGSLALSGNYDIINNIFGGTTNVFWGLTGSSGGVAASFQVCMENLTTLPADTAMCVGTPITLAGGALAGASLDYVWAPVPLDCDCFSYLAGCTGGCNATFCPGFGFGCPSCTFGTTTFNPPTNDTCTYAIAVTNGIGCRDTHAIEVRADCILPVEMGDFAAFPYDGHAILEWNTLSESNSSHFEIQHSLDGAHFDKLGTVIAQGFSHAKQDYQFIDRLPETGTNYYRLKLMDLDGKSNLSEVRTVFFDTPPQHILRSVYPNPTANQVNFRLGIKESCALKIEILSPTGSLVKTDSFEVPSGGDFDFQLQLGGLESGIYFYRCIVDNKVFRGKISLLK